MPVLLVTWLAVAAQTSGGATISLGLVTAGAHDSQSALGIALVFDAPVLESPWGLRAGIEAFSDQPPTVGDGDLEDSNFSGWGGLLEVERRFALGTRASAYVALGGLGGSLWAGRVLTGNAPVCPANPHDVYEDCTSFTRTGVFPRLSAGARVGMAEFGTDFTYARLMGVGVTMFTFRMGLRFPFG